MLATTKQTKQFECLSYKCETILKENYKNTDLFYCFTCLIKPEVKKKNVMLCFLVSVGMNFILKSQKCPDIIYTLLMFDRRNI